MLYLPLVWCTPFHGLVGAGNFHAVAVVKNADPATYTETGCGAAVVTILTTDTNSLRPLWISGKKKGITPDIPESSPEY